jgi:hypothetical protein
MSAPLVTRATGDIIVADDHNDVKSYIEDATYSVNTQSLKIGGSTTIDSNWNGSFIGSVTAGSVITNALVSRNQITVIGSSIDTNGGDINLVFGRYPTTGSWAQIYFNNPIQRFRFSKGIQVDNGVGSFASIDASGNGSIAGSFVTGVGSFGSNVKVAGGLQIDGAMALGAGIGIEKAKITTAGSTSFRVDNSYSGTGSKGYGIIVYATGTGSPNTALFATAFNGENNYAGIFDRGNVGIGTGSPTATLEIAKTDGIPRLRLVGSTAPGIEFHNTSARDWLVWNTGSPNGTIQFRNNTSNDVFSVTQSGHGSFTGSVTALNYSTIGSVVANYGSISTNLVVANDISANDITLSGSLTTTSSLVSTTGSIIGSHLILKTEYALGAGSSIIAEFMTDRPWHLMSTGSATTTALALKSTSDSKDFRILDFTGSTVTNFANNSSAFGLYQKGYGSFSGSLYADNALIAGSLNAQTVITTSNGVGSNIKIGDDAWIGDLNTANTLYILGQNDRTTGSIGFGSGKDTNLYRGAANLLKTDDDFQAVNIGASGSINIENTANPLNLRAGNTASGTTNNQILFSYNSGLSNYRHGIKTRHNSASTGSNAFDFYVWNYGVDGTGSLPTKLALTVDAFGLGVFNQNPQSALDVIGNANITGSITVGSYLGTYGSYSGNVVIAGDIAGTDVGLSGSLVAGSISSSGGVTISAGGLNVTGTQITRGINPASDNAYTLGTSTGRYSAIHGGSIQATYGSFSGNLLVAGSVTANGGSFTDKLISHKFSIGSGTAYIGSAPSFGSRLAIDGGGFSVHFQNLSEILFETTGTPEIELWQAGTARTFAIKNQAAGGSAHLSVQDDITAKDLSLSGSAVIGSFLSGYGSVSGNLVVAGSLYGYGGTLSGITSSGGGGVGSSAVGVAGSIATWSNAGSIGPVKASIDSNGNGSFLGSIVSTQVVTGSMFGTSIVNSVGSNIITIGASSGANIGASLVVSKSRTGPIQSVGLNATNNAAFGIATGSKVILGLSAAGSPGIISLTNSFQDGSKDAPVYLGFNEQFGQWGTYLGAGSQADDIWYTLPLLQGGTDTYLKNSGTGSLSWASVSGGGLSWSAASGSTTIAADTGYYVNSATNVVFTLPASFTAGKTFRIYNANNAAGWQLKQNASQVIYFGNRNTTTGTAGSMVSESVTIGDGIEVLCTTTNTTFHVVNATGQVDLS